MLEPLAELEPARVRRHARRSRTPTAPSIPTRSSAAVRPDTLLVSMMHVNNETGVIQPVAEVADRLDGTDAYLHVDAAQSFGREIDGAASSAHRSDQRRARTRSTGRRASARWSCAAADGQRPPLQPLMFGGGQERGLRPGTMPVAARGRVRPGRRTGGRRKPTTAARAACAFREALLAGPGAARAGRQRRPRRGRSRTSSTCRFPASRRRPSSTRGAIWWRSRTAPPARRRATPAATCLSAMRLPAWRMDGALRFSWVRDSPEPDWSALVAAVEPYRSVEQAGVDVSAPRDQTRLLPPLAVHDASAASTGATRRRTTGCSRSRRASGGSASRSSRPGCSAISSSSSSASRLGRRSASATRSARSKG